MILNGDFRANIWLAIPLNASVSDDKLAVKVEFPEENTWGIPGNSSTFSIDRDATKPLVEVTPRFEDGHYKNGDFTKKPVTVSIDVKDANFLPGADTISILKDGIAYQPTEGPSWKDNQTSLTLDNTGYYEITITAADKAGNKSEPKKVEFGIVKQGPRLTITDREESGWYQQAVELKVDSDIMIHEAIASIEKTVAGETTTEVRNFTKKGKTATLSLTEDADYKVSVIVKDRQNNKDGHQLGTTAFTIDKTAPELVITGVEDGGEYSESKEVTISVNDSNVDVSRTELKITRDNEATTYKGKEAYKPHSLSKEGVYVLQVTAADRAGNTASKQLTFIIDKSAPELEITV